MIDNKVGYLCQFQAQGHFLKNSGPLPGFPRRHHCLDIFVHWQGGVNFKIIDTKRMGYRKIGTSLTNSAIAPLDFSPFKFWEWAM